MTTPGRAPRPLKEAFFVQVMTPDKNLIFFDETNNLGRKNPYDKPEATCAMRASENVVSFTLLKLTNRTRAEVADAKLELPRGPLDRTDRRAVALSKDLPANVIAVEIEDSVYHLTIARDENGVVTLDVPEGVEDASFELKGRLRMTIVMHSPRGSKILAAGFQGHMGKPGSSETVTRVTAMALNVLSGLTTFRMVSGIETVTVPASPARYAAARPALKASDRVRVLVPVRLWSGDAAPQPVGSTTVEIELDLETANPISGRILFHLKVPADVAEVFAPYESLVSDAALSLVQQHLGLDELSELVYSIALGELSAGDIERLRDAAATITGLDVNPREWVKFVPVAA